MKFAGTIWRKVNLAAHIVSSIGWLGALAGFLALSIVGLVGPDERTVRAAYVASGVITRFVIVPFALASMLSGIIQALSSSWGLFRHYWTLFKFLIALIATFLLLMKVGPIRDIARAAGEMDLSNADFRGLRVSLAVHAIGGIVVLLWATGLAVFKPRGITPYTGRK